MTTAVIPRMQGDDYQARFFWMEATRLFQPHTKVVRVGFELEGLKSFDDVATFYDPPIQDEYGNSLSADYFQIKFHVDHAGAFTWQALMDPAFINATAVSLLQRLRDAALLLAPEGKGCRFNVFAPWGIAPDDALAKLISNRNGEVRQQILFDGTTEKSAMGKIRKAWREHLGVDDATLQCILSTLRIQTHAGTLEQLRDRVNDKLQLAGLAPVPAGCQGFLYDDLIRKFRAAGRYAFTREELCQACDREGLWQGQPAALPGARQLGVRSFLRWAEHMEDETDAMVCLLRYFDGRFIREARLWNGAVQAELQEFLVNAVRDRSSYHLHLDAHASLAFAAGYYLDTKAGVDITPVQRTLAGKQLWSRPPAGTVPSSPLWNYHEVFCTSGGTDVALAVSVTHDLAGDVEAYVRAALPSVRRILVCIPAGGTGQSAVRDGAHAWTLAQELSMAVRRRSPEERRGVLHLFSSTPNALLFFLGQFAGGFGRCILYEYDFAGNAAGAYEPSLTFPPAAVARSPEPVTPCGGV